MDTNRIVNQMKTAVNRASDKVAGREVEVRTDEATQPSSRRTIAPLVDVFENDDELLVIADVPRATPKDVEVGWDGASAKLTVRAPRGEVDWYRSFHVPDYVDGERAHSALDNGVLRIHLPKRETARPRTIPVTAG